MRSQVFFFFSEGDRVARQFEITVQPVVGLCFHSSETGRGPPCVVVDSCDGDLAASSTRTEFFFFFLRLADLVLTLYHNGDKIVLQFSLEDWGYT